MKRRADTLVEVIIAMSAFAIIMGGTFDFMANQSKAMVKMRERDDINFWAQKWLNISYDVAGFGATTKTLYKVISLDEDGNIRSKDENGTNIKISEDLNVPGASDITIDKENVSIKAYKHSPYASWSNTAWSLATKPEEVERLVISKGSTTLTFKLK